MRKKIFTFLLALAASVGLSWATVITWDASKVSSMAMIVSSGSDSKTSDGITVTAVSTGEFVVFGDHGGAIEIGNGEGSGGGYLTFTSSVGNIAQIDIYHSGAGEWNNANGDWISPYYENFEGGIFSWSGTPAASITLTGDAPRHIDDITSIEFTIEDGGGSAQAGLQVTELQVLGSWQDNPTMLSTSDMPGFVAITEAEAAAWDAAPAGEVALIFAFEGDGATSLSFKNGVYQAAQAHNITYEDLYAWYSEGEKIFYTGGGSTPTPTPAESVTVVFEANNNQKEVEVTLPHTFACDFQNGQGELDGIIQELYALQYGGYCQAFNVPTATGNEAVTASKDGNNHYIAISEAFEGTATVTGNYIKYLDTEHMGNTSVDYTLTISVQGSTLDPEPATGLQVVEVTSDIYDGWNSNSNTFTVDALPGFQAVTFDEAKEWTGVPTSGTAALVYRTNGDYARVIHFFNGTIVDDYDLETSFNQMYENITLFGNRIFYTAGGGSTPTPDPTPTPTPSGDGDKLAGAFSVGGNKVVYFSKANLQATTTDNGSTWTWGFAENQWDYVGNSAANNAINGGGTVSANGAVDLFAWSSVANNYYGINNSINEADYSGDFKDWGAKMGSDWHTLTINEWQYLLQERNPGSSSANHTSYPRYTNAQILTDGTAPQKDINGIILFPDDFNDGGESIDGVTWGSINPSFYSSSPTYCTTAGWATLESMGCVFLPSAGSRQNFGDEFAILYVNQMGNYWSSTLYSGEPEDPQSIAVGNGTLGIGTNPRYFGMSVRLVSETAPSGGSTPEPSETTVTWDLSDMESMGTQGGYFKAKGITLMAYGVDNGMTGDGIYGGAYFGGPFVFTTSLGKFTKIEVTNSHLYEQPAFSGDGWTLDGTNAVWEGTPAALVSLVSNFGGITQIKFTIDPNTSTPANSCGDGLTWAVNDGVLTISYDGVGTGSMDNYDDPLSMPWYGQNITSVVLPEGLISIGQNAFAFINTFSQITLPSTLQYILMNAFSGCGLTSVTIPENVKGISASAFISSQSLATVTFEPTTPPRVGGNAFEYCHNDLIIHYPCESKALYYNDMQADIAYYHDKMYNCPASPSNLHVTELEPPASWSGKSTYLAVADHMPGFEETDAELAKTWEAPTDCNSILIYHVAEQYGDDRMYYHYFNAGNFVESEDGWYPLGTVYSNATNNGIKTFYTSSGGGSTNPEIKLYADFGGDWADTDAFTDNGDGTATLTIPSLEAKHNAIFVKKDGVQMSSGHNFTRENPSADVSGNQLAMWFDADEAGEYTFTFEYSTNILTITYPTLTPTPAPSDDANKLPGAFSVSGTKVVYFSKGNLQATTDNGSTWTWGFAENQYDFIGNAAANNAINGGGSVSENGAVDLFGWSSNANDYYGIDNSMSVDDYSGNFQDWSAKVGSDWHALNGAQWEYLLLTREPGSLAGGTSNPRFTRATILTDGTAPSQDIFGLILFPDNFNDGGEYIDGVTWNGINSHSSYVSPTYCTTAGWATLESMGCVFLPAPGWRSGNEVTNVGAFGIYWSSTKYSEEDASCIYFSNTDVAAFHSYITTGASVRLVSETAPSPAPTSFTFPAGTTIYYDFTAYGNGINVYAPGAPDWYDNTANIIPVTLSSDWEISESTNLFKSDASGWNFVTGTILPTDGQNMIVSTNGVDYAWGTHVPAYTVAGEPAVAFGTPTWTPTNTDNDMVKQSNGTYKWEKEGVELAKDAVVSFKVCQDHGWDVAYPNDNFNHTILADGIYTLTITFDPNAEGDKVAINAFKTADVVVAQTAEMKGFGDWNTGIALENINEGAAARVTKNLAAGAHEFKMIINDGWRGKVGATITRANNTVAEIVDNPNESNITLTADIPGDYIFTWTYETNTLSVEFPSLVVYVQNLIAAIGEVTLESGDAINAARTAYDNLLDADQKQAVNNYGVLEAAEATYAALAQAAADQLAANNVKNLIDAIDNPVVYTQACKDKIDAARAAYDALTDAQKTLVGVEYAQKLADAEAAYDAFIVYTVAGEPEALFGSFWNIEDTNNDMVKQLNGTYKWEKTDVALAAGIAKFKIIKDHVTYEYPTSNYELNIAEDGIYTVTIIYDPKAAEDRITTNATKTGEAVIVHTAETKGSWNNWTDGLVFENINEGAAARASKILTPGTYEFKMIIDGSWLGEASTTFTRNENAKAEIGGDEDNLKINADIPGSYTFTWTYETNTLEIGYPNYIDANLAIDFRTNPYSVVSGVEQSASVMVEGSMNTGDAAHGYRLPVISIPVTAGNYKVMMGTCSYSNQDATIKTEDNSYTYATLETNNGTCYHQNTATNVVGAIFTVPTDQIIKVYGAEYTPFFSIEKMAAVPAFTDFELNFQTNPYNEISGAKPEGTVIIGTYHDNLHGYQNVEAVVPVEAGNYRLTVGACQYGTPGNVMSETNAELASFNSNLGEGNCYHNNTAANIVSKIFTVDMDQTITINGGAYMPYMKLEKLLDNTYYINFENAEGAIGTIPGEIAITAGDSWTIPANLTLYKEGYTFVGWSDGVNTYAPGDEFFPNAHGTLQAVYTPNSVSIADASTINVKWYFGENAGAPSVTWQGTTGYLLAKGEVDGELIDLKLDIDATSGKFHNAGRGDKWAQVNANTVFAFPSKEGAVVSVETYSGNETYDLAAGTLTCNTNDYYSYLEIVYPAPTTAVVIGDPNDADQVTAFLSTYEGQTVPNLTIDRPVLNNMYNTLCLPFHMDADQIANSSLNGVEIYEFIDADVTNDELYLYTSEEKHEIVAGRPYLVKFSAASQLDDLDFVNVTINNANLDDQAVTIKGVTFKGTFQPIVLGKQTELNFNGGHLFLMANNTLMWPNTNNPLKPFRAYFTVNVDAGQSAGMPVRRGMPAHIGGPAQILTGVENVQGDNVQSTKIVENGVLYIIKNGVRYNAQGQIVK